jgi:hypothetical protein
MGTLLDKKVNANDANDAKECRAIEKGSRFERVLVLVLEAVRMTLLRSLTPSARAPNSST